MNLKCLAPMAHVTTICFFVFTQNQKWNWVTSHWFLGKFWSWSLNLFWLSPFPSLRVHLANFWCEMVFRICYILCYISTIYIFTIVKNKSVPPGFCNLQKLMLYHAKSSVFGSAWKCSKLLQIWANMSHLMLSQHSQPKPSLIHMCQTWLLL